MVDAKDAGPRFEFDRDTWVEPDAEGGFRAKGSPGWTIGSNPNGGYLASIALAALARSVPHHDPLAVTAHYASRVSPGPVGVEVDVLRTGRGLSTVVARLVQEGDVRVQVTAAFGDLSAREGPTVVTAERPSFPPPEACVPVDPSIPGVPEIMRRLDMRLTPESAGFAIGRRSGVAAMEGWVRFADGREPDT